VNYNGKDKTQDDQEDETQEEDTGQQEVRNWDKIEYLMLQSFTGQRLTEDEQKLVQEAYKADPKQYGERSQRVRGDEIQRRQRFE
jgi:hypothetical protein